MRVYGFHVLHVHATPIILYGRGKHKPYKPCARCNDCRTKLPSAEGSQRGQGSGEQSCIRRLHVCSISLHVQYPLSFFSKGGAKSRTKEEKFARANSAPSRGGRVRVFEERGGRILTM